MCVSFDTFDSQMTTERIFVFLFLFLIKNVEINILWFVNKTKGYKLNFLKKLSLKYDKLSSYITYKGRKLASFFFISKHFFNEVHKLMTKYVIFWRTTRFSSTRDSIYDKTAKYDKFFISLIKQK